MKPISNLIKIQNRMIEYEGLPTFKLLRHQIESKKELNEIEFIFFSRFYLFPEYYWDFFTSRDLILFNNQPLETKKYDLNNHNNQFSLNLKMLPKRWDDILLKPEIEKINNSSGYNKILNYFLILDEFQLFNFKIYKFNTCTVSNRLHDEIKNDISSYVVLPTSKNRLSLMFKVHKDVYLNWLYINNNKYIIGDYFYPKDLKKEFDNERGFQIEEEFICCYSIKK